MAPNHRRFADTYQLTLLPTHKLCNDVRDVYRALVEGAYHNTIDDVIALLKEERRRNEMLDAAWDLAEKRYVELGLVSGSDEWEKLCHVAIICYTIDEPPAFEDLNQQFGRLTTVKETVESFPYKAWCFLLIRASRLVRSSTKLGGNVRIYRGIGAAFHSPLRIVKIGTFLSFRQFVSASPKSGLAKECANTGTVIEILSPGYLMAKGISSYSMRPEEDEVIIWPWIVFEVVGKVYNSSIQKVIVKCAQIQNELFIFPLDESVRGSPGERSPSIISPPPFDKSFPEDFTPLRAQKRVSFGKIETVEIPVFRDSVGSTDEPEEKSDDEEDSEEEETETEGDEDSSTLEEEDSDKADEKPVEKVEEPSEKNSNNKSIEMFWDVAAHVKDSEVINNDNLDIKASDCSTPENLLNESVLKIENGNTTSASTEMKSQIDSVEDQMKETLKTVEITNEKHVLLKSNDTQTLLTDSEKQPGTISTDEILKENSHQGTEQAKTLEDTCTSSQEPLKAKERYEMKASELVGELQKLIKTTEIEASRTLESKETLISKTVNTESKCETLVVSNSIDTMKYEISKELEQQTKILQVELKPEVSISKENYRTLESKESFTSNSLNTGLRQEAEAISKSLDSTSKLSFEKTISQEYKQEATLQELTEISDEIIADDDDDVFLTNESMASSSKKSSLLQKEQNEKENLETNALSAKTEKSKDRYEFSSEAEHLKILETVEMRDTLDEDSVDGMKRKGKNKRPTNEVQPPLRLSEIFSDKDLSKEGTVVEIVTKTPEANAVMQRQTPAFETFKRSPSREKMELKSIQSNPIQSGTNVTVDADGTIRVQLEDGTVESKSVDGTVRKQYPNGTMEVYEIDGTIKVYHRDGCVESLDTNGLMSVTFPDGTIHQRDADGTIRIVDKSGSLMTMDTQCGMAILYPDGTMDMRDADGTVRSVYSDETAEVEQPKRQSLVMVTYM